MCKSDTCKKEIVPEVPKQPLLPLCPGNGQKGKAVELETVKGLLSISLRNVPAEQFYFCKDPTCPVVYFSATQTFTTTQVREPVFQKQSGNQAVLVCYCFQYTLGEIVNGSAEQVATIIKDIRQGIDGGQCACEIRNPQGSCCLGNITHLSRSLPKGNLK